jgi:hypothetical protein
MTLGSNGFGERVASVGFVEEALALKVRGFDEIAVNDAQAAQAGAHQKAGDDCAQGAAAHEDSAGGQKTSLSGFANASEKHLARVSFELLRVHTASALQVFIIAPFRKERGNKAVLTSLLIQIENEMPEQNRA